MDTNVKPRADEAPGPSQQQSQLLSLESCPGIEEERDGVVDRQVQDKISIDGRVPSESDRCLNKVGKLMDPSDLCPTNTRVHYIATHLEIYLMLGVLVYVIISFSWAEAIRSAVIQLFVLYTLAQVFGVLTGMVRLPPLLGMLLAGLLLRNIDFFHADGNFLKITGTIRSCAMAVILLRAGLGLDGRALRRLSLVVLRVAIFPCTAEAVTVAVLSHYLFAFPWLWGFLLGFVLGAVSPAVVVPSLLILQREGYGENKGIATLVIAASSLDDVFAITLFGVFLSTIFLQGSIVKMLLQGPLELAIGIAWGILMGVITIYIPHFDEESVTKLRTIMVGGSGLLAVLGSQVVGYAGAGPLGCITSAFLASCGWRAFSQKTTFEPVMENFNDYWLYLQPFLFGLIGTEIDMFALDSHTVGFGILIVMLSVLVRTIVCCLSVQGCGLNFQETLFVGLSWLPKATVQAAIGPVALDLARNSLTGQDQNIQFAKSVLTIAVLAILITAPLGAIGIFSTGPLLLSRSTAGSSIFSQKSERVGALEESYPA